MSRAAGVRPHEKFEGVYWVGLEDRRERLATENLNPGQSIYGEELVRRAGKEYRLWGAYRSKLASGILRGLRVLPIEPNSSVLYLGSASGTTASHVSDIVGLKGIVFCVEFAQRVMRDFIDNVASKRNNLVPILGDVRFPDEYRSTVSPVDVIYCDVAQPEQANLLAENAARFLSPNGMVLIAIKSRSIDVTLDPSVVFKHEVEQLRSREFEIIQEVKLEPYERDHELVLAQKAKNHGN